MGVEVFHVICQARETSGGPGGRQEYTATQIKEALGDAHGITEKVIVTGPYETATVVTLEAETAAQAAKFVKYILKYQVLGVPQRGSTNQTNKEGAEKPVNTAKTTGWENTAAV